MKPRQREPITPEERDTIRQKRREGASLEELAQEFRCSPITARRICSNVLPRTWPGPRPKEDKPVRQRVRWSPEIIGGVNPGGIRWTPEEDKRLFDLLQEGCTIRQIAEKLDRNYASVKDKVARLWRGGESPRKKGDAPPLPPRQPRVVKEQPNTSRVKCLKCLKAFDSYDPRRNRICARCKDREDWN
jgi:hypothetical protein